MAEAIKQERSSICKGPTCGERIFWREHNGKMHPFNEDGVTSHFGTCIDRDLFRGGAIKTKKSDVKRY